MGRKYNVLVIAISLKGNKIARHGCKPVDEAQLAGDPQVLVDGGYIELIGKPSPSDDPVPTENELLIKEVKLMTVPDLQKYSTDNDLGVNFEQNKPGLLADILKLVTEAKD